MSSRRRRKKTYRIVRLLAVLIAAVVIIGLCLGILKVRRSNRMPGGNDSAAAQEFSVDEAEGASGSDADEPGGDPSGEQESSSPESGTEKDEKDPEAGKSGADRDDSSKEDGSNQSGKGSRSGENGSGGNGSGKGSGSGENGSGDSAGSKDGADSGKGSDSEQDRSSGETDASATEPVQVIEWNGEWKYADYSAIHSDTATLYRSEAAGRKNLVVCVNAGHGTKGGTDHETLCHPDGTPKYVGGSTDAGEKYASSISRGTTLNDGTTEAEANLELALTLKQVLLDSGYDVLMVRENDDTQLDNIARTVMANQYADCHIALHYNSSDIDKGAFYVCVPDVDAYKNMEPVKTWWREHNALGEALIDGLDGAGIKIWQYRSMGIDLTQTSYSTIPSVDLEVGDRASTHGPEKLQKIAEGIRDGVDAYYGF